MRRVTLLFIVSVAATAVLALFTLFTPTAQADEVGGIIDTDTTWTLAGSPYIITDTVIIQPNVTLTVEAGVEVQTQPNRGITVNGLLLAVGTAVAPITFTSSANNAPGQWQGIVVNGGEVSLAHAEVRYATTNLTVNSPTSTVAITSSRLISTSLNSIAVNDGSLYAACSVIAGNGQNGVSVAASGSPSVTITTSEIWGMSWASATVTAYL